MCEKTVAADGRHGMCRACGAICGVEARYLVDKSAEFPR